MEQRKKLFRIIDPSVPSAEEGKGNEGLKPERESGAPTSVCRAGPKKPLTARLGKPPADDCIPFRGEGMSSEGKEFDGRVGNSSAGSNLSPFSHFLNLFSLPRAPDSSSP